MLGVNKKQPLFCILNANLTCNEHNGRHRLAMVFSCLLVLLGVAGQANADCGWGYTLEPSCKESPGYSVVFNDYHGYVSVYVDNAYDGICDESSVMLRENVDTGEVAILPLRVKTRTNDLSPNRYLDRCVPSGTYRYGCSQPFECTSSTSGTVTYYEEFTVDHGDAGVDLDACEQENEGYLPQPYYGNVPWSGSGDNVVCVGTCSNGDSGVLDGSAQVAFFNGGIALLGLTLLVRRRRRRGRD